jgi:superfamily II DNA/RNA helicase
VLKKKKLKMKKVCIFFHDLFTSSDFANLYFLENEYLKPNWDQSVDRFDEMGLKEEVLRGIYGYGFNKPSPIQQKGILPVIQGNDTIA